jgi:hypothetical protein
LINVVYNSFFSYHFLCNLLIPSMVRQPFQAKLHVEGKQNSLPEVIRISRVEAQHNRPIRHSASSKDNIPSGSIRKDEEERLKAATDNLKLVHQKAKLMLNDVCDLFFGCYSPWPFFRNNQGMSI